MLFCKTEHENITLAPHKVQRKFAFNHVFLQIMQKTRPFFPFTHVRGGRRFVIENSIQSISNFESKLKFQSSRGFKLFYLFSVWVLIQLSAVFFQSGVDIPRKDIPRNQISNFLENLFIQTANAQSAATSNNSTDTSVNYTLSSTDSAFVDSLMQLTNWDDYPAMYFIDSLRNPKQKDRFISPFYLQIPDRTVRVSNDPFNPFIHDTYLRKARGKFWFFGISVFIALYIIYFRAAFGKQLELRLSSFLKSYHFEDLLREQAISSAAGSIHAYAIGILVFSQGVMLSLITSEYNRLNNFYIYLLLLVAVGGFFSILYLIQWIFTGSMELEGILNRQVQRQINVNLVFTFLSLPVFLYVYYNATEMQNQSISVWLWSVLIVWISVRLLFQLWGILRDNAISLTTILYLCALEIIPYLLVFKFLSSSI
jgi:hypothetical protein